MVRLKKKVIVIKAEMKSRLSLLEKGKRPSLSLPPHSLRFQRHHRDDVLTQSRVSHQEDGRRRKDKLRELSAASKAQWSVKNIT